MEGKIRVETENIFPIIKKFLYSEHDIFLRELVSNSIDALHKLKTLSALGEAKGELGELKIDIEVNETDKTITIADTGLGMTSDEVDQYLNQVAFSGAEEFMKKYKGQAEGSVIGHFGLGFYSAFMVSNQVEVFTKSFKEAPAAYWSCTGTPEYTLKPTDKSERGTKIVLHINSESEEFLKSERLKTVLKKFCKFLPFPIFFEKEQINNTAPIWIKKPTELTDEDYTKFYAELYPFAEAPLFWIHLNVDYPFNLTGILYFPKIKQQFEIQKDKIQLYSNQVFVTDEVKDIVPEFLMMLHGVIDSPDIPLNVSRSYLQGDPNVKKINSYITKKVAEALEKIFNTDRKSFETKWENVGLFIKYGMITDDKFLEKANTFFLLETTNNQFLSLDEYKKNTESLQKNKEGKHIILYTSQPIQQDSYVQAALAKGYTVARLETLIDAAFISQIEMKWEGVQFVRVDSDIADNLIDKAEIISGVLSKENEDKLKSLFNTERGNLKLMIDLKALSPDSSPLIATRPEMMRRMKDMAATNPSMSWYKTMPEEVTLTINSNHPIYEQLLTESDIDKQSKQIKSLTDLALLGQGLLEGSELTQFIQRSVELMSETKPRLIIT